MSEKADHESLSKEWDEAQNEWEAARHHHRYIVDKHMDCSPGEGVPEIREAERRLDEAFKRLQRARDLIV